MALPVPCNMPIAQLMQYTPAQPPAYLQLSLPNELANYGYAISSLVANEAAQKANMNASRMFCFNMMAYNNWQNQYYKETVELTAALAILMIAKGQCQNVDMALVQATSTVLTLIASRFVFEFPELKAHCTPDIINSATTNYGVLNNLKNEIAMLQNSRSNMGNRYPVPQMGQQMYPGGYQQAPMQPAIPMTTGFGVATNTPTSGGFGTQVSSRHDVVVNRPAPVAPIMETPINREEQVYRSIYRQLREIEKMDRDQHTIVFPGTSYAVERHRHTFLTGEAADKLAKTAASKSADELNGAYLNSSTLMTECLDAAIFEGRIIQQQRRREGEEVGIFCCRALIGQPSVTIEAYDEIIDSILEGDTIQKITINFRAIYESLNKTEDNNHTSLLALLKLLDRHITRLINRFLKIEMGLMLNIDGVVEDGDTLYSYIVQNYPPEIVAFFYRQESKMISNLLTKMDEENREEFYKEYTGDTGVNVTLISSLNVLMLIDMFEEELGFNFKVGDVYRIEADRHYMLHSLCKAMNACKEKMEWSSETDYLITADNVKFTLHKSLVNGDFLIVKV